MTELGSKEFIAGTMGGVAQVLSGQPFDIIKVRQATSSSPMSAFSATLSIIKTEGALAFWRGSTAPVLGVGACVSIQFGVLENAKRYVSKSKGKPLETTDFILCGSIAGMANTIVSAPAEHFRIKMQVQGKVDPRGDPLYKNDADCIRTIFRNHGLAGAYKGFLVTLLREAVTFGSYFGAYEYIVHNYLIPKGGTKKDVEVYKLFLTGGISGYFYWAPWYPIDAVKSKLQGDSLANPRYAGAMDCVRKTLASEGVGGFYKGFWTCMFRAFPVNATTFLVYELTMRAIG
jgi:solute carrier family 25 (mitochondrial carnitine/acylcarnitine transporter), member 20/29